jgi:proton-dependent oligopeptide transporter, POT family
MLQRIADIRAGFERPFWIANTTEIFERLSYYAVFAVLALYLNKTLAFPLAQAGALSGIFGGAVWIMAVFGGALADRIGFRRALSTAYLILTLAYFLVGSVGASWLAPVRAVVPLGVLAGVILFLPALGIALVKPSVVGTTARASKENVRSIGYAIYYTMVNIGSTLGPLLAGWLSEHAPPQAVFMMAAVSVFLMFWVVIIFFKEPGEAVERAASLVQVGRNFVTVLGNWRFVLFLTIFSGYWIVFWQQFLNLPPYIEDFVDPKANSAFLLSIDPFIVITLTVAVNALTRWIPPIRALTLGTIITACGWLVLAVMQSVVGAALSLVLVALGEIIQSPRYYEYISRIAPAGQEGTYLGFAFLPLGIGSLIGGPLGGALLAHFGQEQHHPAVLWVIMTLIGVLTAALLWLYDRFAVGKS